MSADFITRIEHVKECEQKQHCTNTKNWNKSFKMTHIYLMRLSEMMKDGCVAITLKLNSNHSSGRAHLNFGSTKPITLTATSNPYDLFLQHSWLILMEFITWLGNYWRIVSCFAEATKRGFDEDIQTSGTAGSFIMTVQGHVPLSLCSSYWQ